MAPLRRSPRCRLPSSQERKKREERGRGGPPRAGGRFPAARCVLQTLPCFSLALSPPLPARLELKMAPLFLSPGPNCEEQSGSARAGRVGGTPLEVLQKPHAGCRSGRSYTNTRLRELRAGSWGAAGARCPLLPSPLGHPGAPNRARGLSPSNPFSFQPRLFPTSMRDAGCAAHGLGCVFGGFPAEFCKGKQAGGIRGSPQPDGEAPRSSWCACAIVPPPPFFFFLYI